MRHLATVTLLLLTSIISPLHAQDKVGLVLMHGKWGTASDSSPVGGLADYLRGKDFLVVTPSMSWHRERLLDKNYEDSLLAQTLLLAMAQHAKD